jgi:putative mycofactocin binding protein MftB
MAVTLEDRLELNPQVALRPERFGALAYHFGNRRLSFLKHPDLVRVVESLGSHATVRDALIAAGIEQGRWPAFLSALATLETSEMVRAA